MFEFLLGAGIIILFIGIAGLIAYLIKKRPKIGIALLLSFIFISMSWTLGDLLLNR